MSKFAPMLAGKAPTDLSSLRYPLMVSPKLDGIRAIVKDGVLLSRNLKPIPNLHCQSLFSHLEGYDGELIVGNASDKDCFRNTSSGVMSRDGTPDAYYHVFDRHDMEGSIWEDRYFTLYEGSDPGNVVQVDHHLVYSPDHVTQWEEHYLELGYEGVMLRATNGLYKNGRSTVREGWLLKLKRFEDSEALVLGMEEKMHNANELQTNELGYAKRTSHQENLVPMGTMGALIVRDVGTGVEFNIGTGFSDEDRAWWWDLWSKASMATGDFASRQANGGLMIKFNKPNIIVKYKYFPSGSKDKPRFPTYLGIRDLGDM